ncbi:hypothetical protein CPC08DRAFT_313276 [Agrocybe pediades]|nr:hypothetical protein CPC08DRAFT_313276 [Agrocybe pediades]
MHISLRYLLSSRVIVNHEILRSWGVEECTRPLTSDTPAYITRRQQRGAAGYDRRVLALALHSSQFFSESLLGILVEEPSKPSSAPDSHDIILCPRAAPGTCAQDLFMHEKWGRCCDSRFKKEGLTPA